MMHSNANSDDAVTIVKFSVHVDSYHLSVSESEKIEN